MTSIEDRCKRLKLDDNVGMVYHTISGPRVEVHGDHATSEVMWAVLSRDTDENPQLTSTGRHIDELAREDGAIHQW
jgi:SnoaL-like domain